MPTSFDHIFSEVWYIFMKSGNPNIFDHPNSLLNSRTPWNGVLQFARKSKMVKILGSTKFHQNIPNFTEDIVKTCGYCAYGTEWKDEK